MKRLRMHLTAIVAALVMVAGGLVMAGTSSASDIPHAAQRFVFTSTPLPPVRQDIWQQVRRVPPPFKHIEGWVSAVGAAVALTDADGNGFNDDVCLVDPRADTVTVRPAPGGRSRYKPFALIPRGVTYVPVEMAPTGCLPGDFNEDGRTDFLVYYWGRSPIVFLRVADSAAPSAAGFIAQDLLGHNENWATETVTSTDLDGDGHLDLVVGNYFPNNVDLLGHEGSSAAEARQAMPNSMSDAGNGGRNRILRWSAAWSDPVPSVTFEDVPDALTPRQAAAWTLAIGAQDLNGDLLPELYFANDFGPDNLLLNVSSRGHIAFREVRGVGGVGIPHSKVLGMDSFKGMGIDFADLNDDANIDMFVSNMTAPFGLMETHFAWINTGSSADWYAGRAPFVDKSDSLGLANSGWAWDAKFGDFDNDGTPELYQTTGFLRGDGRGVWPQLQELAHANDSLLSDVANWPEFRAGVDVSGHEPNAFFARADGGTWTDIGASVGMNSDTVARGVATGDVDGDGRLDLAVANQWAESRFYHNACGRCGASLQLRLLLPPGATGSGARVLGGAVAAAATGSPAIGATVRLALPSGRTMIQQVDGGNGHASVRAPELHFGLGESAPAAIDATITWRDRSGNVQEWRGRLSPGRHTIELSGEVS